VLLSALLTEVLTMPTQQRNKGRARVMWADLGEVERAHHGPLTPSQRYCTQSPVFVLPATPEAVEEMRERLYCDIMEAVRTSSPGYTLSSRECNDAANAVLASLGLSLHHRKGRKS